MIDWLIYLSRSVEELVAGGAHPALGGLVGHVAADPAVHTAHFRFLRTLADKTSLY